MKAKRDEADNVNEDESRIKDGHGNNEKVVHNEHNNNNNENNYLLASSVRNKTDFHDHNMLVYPNLATYRKIYSESAKLALDNDEVVFLVTTYDSFDRIKDSLMKVGISVSNETKAGNLIIMDAIKAYQIDTYGAAKFVTSLVKKSETDRKAGIFALTEMGSFFIAGRIALLLEYETSLHKKLEIRLKATCTYHEDDFSALSKIQQETILLAHNTVIR